MKILWVSDHPALRFVGQSRVTREICLRLAVTHDVYVLGYCPPALELPAEKFPFVVERCVRGDVAALENAIKKYEPDHVVLSHDCWLFPFLPQLKSKLPNVSFVGYFTIDGEPFNPRWAAIAYACDAVLVPSQYGVEVLKDTCPDVFTCYAPYGVSCDFYKRRENRQLKIGNYTIKVPEFVVTYYGHNQSKKNIGNALLGWEKFTQGKPNCLFVLVVHTTTIQQGKKNIRHGYDLMLYTYIANLLVLETVATDEQLSQLLSVSDSLLFPSLGEGFGLPPLEAMACGCVPIVSNYASTKDYCSVSNSLLLDWVPMVGEKDVVRAIVPPDEIAKALEYRYKIRGSEQEKQMIENGYKAASSYTWAKTTSTLIKVLEEAKQLSRINYIARY